MWETKHLGNCYYYFSNTFVLYMHIHLCQFAKKSMQNLVTAKLKGGTDWKVFQLFFISHFKWSDFSPFPVKQSRSISISTIKFLFKDFSWIQNQTFYIQFHRGPANIIFTSMMDFKPQFPHHEMLPGENRRLRIRPNFQKFATLNQTAFR